MDGTATSTSEEEAIASASVEAAVQSDGTLDAKEEEALGKALSQAEGDKVTLQVKWKTASYSLVLPLDCTVAFLKMQIAIQTNVKPEHQKLIMKVKGKLDDLQLLRLLGLKDGERLMVVGNEEKDMPQDRAPTADVVDDLDNDTDYSSEDLSVRTHPAHRAKLDKFKTIISIVFISPPRPNKRLLVLDLDYTLFDMKTQADDLSRLRRPFTHRFLAALYERYELVVWSQTSWRWLEMKLTELGILTHPQYRVLFVLDKSCMFRVTAPASSSSSAAPRKHHVKALELIWHKLPQYSAANTVHVDDLGRNFAMNPQSGLKIRAYKYATVSRATDRELLYLQHYLQAIARDVPDFSALDHSAWKDYLQRIGNSTDKIDRDWNEANGGSSASSD